MKPSEEIIAISDAGIRAIAILFCKTIKEWSKSKDYMFFSWNFQSKFIIVFYLKSKNIYIFLGD